MLLCHVLYIVLLFMVCKLENFGIPTFEPCTSIFSFSCFRVDKAWLLGHLWEILLAFRLFHKKYFFNTVIQLSVANGTFKCTFRFSNLLWFGVSRIQWRYCTSFMEYQQLLTSLIWIRDILWKKLIYILLWPNYAMKFNFWNKKFRNIYCEINIMSIHFGITFGRRHCWVLYRYFLKSLYEIMVKICKPLNAYTCISNIFQDIHLRHQFGYI